MNLELEQRLTKAAALDHKRQDESLIKITDVIHGWYIRLVKASGNRVTLYKEVAFIHAQFMRRLHDTFFEELHTLISKAYEESSEAIISAMPENVTIMLLRDNGIHFDNGSVQEGLFDIASKVGRLLQEVIFQPIKKTIAHTIIVASQAAERLYKALRTVTASSLISVITQGQLQGLSQLEIGKKLLAPIAEIVKSDVARATRTATAIVTNKARMESYQKLGSILIGFQLHTHPPDPGSRWWHLKRRFQKYYFKPQEGQLGMSSMPNPPFEPPDPSERPSGTPFTAYNCRCWLIPIVRVPADISNPRFPNGGAV